MPYHELQQLSCGACAPADLLCVLPTEELSCAASPAGSSRSETLSGRRTSLPRSALAAPAACRPVLSRCAMRSASFFPVAAAPRPRNSTASASS